MNNLGAGLRDRYARTGDLADLARAIACWEEAVAGTPEGAPERVSRLNNLGAGLMDRYARTGDLADLAEAVKAYEQAWEFLEKRLAASPVAYKLGQQEEWSGLFARLVSAHLQMAAANPAAAAAARRRALLVAEGTKSRLLTGMVGRGIPLPSDIPPEEARQEQELRDELEAIDLAELATHGTPSPEGEGSQRRFQRGQEVRQTLLALWQKWESQSPEWAEFVALRRGDPPTWDGLARLAQDLGPQAALLSLFTTADEILLFLLRAGWEEPIAVKVPIHSEELHWDYVANYQDEVLNRHIHLKAKRPLTNRWQTLGMRLLPPLLPYLDGISHLVIAPKGPFHILPLHILPIHEAGETLLDRCSVSYVPALSLLLRLRRQERVEEGKAVVMGYTPADPRTEEGQRERALFLGEARAVAGQMGVEALLDDAADAAHLRQSLHNGPIRLLHLSCHGYFGVDPLHAGVLLADGLFTARDWLRLRFRADLVTLSACETGLARSLGGDEVVGLGASLLAAGASSAVLGMWSVNAWTTAALMEGFYRRLWDEKGEKRTDKATALREAALALRDGQLLPTAGLDLSDPYYWGAFALMGDWR
ncbi:MAG: CHAT domain-containing protein [Chloroflexi bacterium]|nr:CHAT domain-containing protein [Chloroflexota bacterium]